MLSIVSLGTHGCSSEHRKNRISLGGVQLDEGPHGSFDTYDLAAMSTNTETDVGAAFVAMSRFKVRNGSEMTARVKTAFRLNLVDDAPGFVRMDVISPLDDPDEIWLLTYWHDERSFSSWHRSHHYSDAHKGIPKGLKLVRGSFELRFFEHISD